MNNATLRSLFSLFLLVLLAARPAPQAPDPDVIDIQVSPHTILLSWETKGNVRVTVHADINYSTVATYSVQLGGFDAVYTKADARGDLVAKFTYEDVAQLVGAGGAILVLSGTRTDGTTFRGEDEVRVVD